MEKGTHNINNIFCDRIHVHGKKLMHNSYIGKRKVLPGACALKVRKHGLVIPVLIYNSYCKIYRTVYMTIGDVIGSLQWYDDNPKCRKLSNMHETCWILKDTRVFEYLLQTLTICLQLMCIYFRWVSVQTTFTEHKWNRVVHWIMCRISISTTSTSNTLW